MQVLTVDLRDKLVRDAARSAAPGLFLSDGWERLTGESVSLVEAPIRMLLLMPMGAELAQDPARNVSAVLCRLFLMLRLQVRGMTQSHGFKGV